MNARRSLHRLTRLLGWPGVVGLGLLVCGAAKLFGKRPSSMSSFETLE